MFCCLVKLDVQVELSSSVIENLVEKIVTIMPFLDLSISKYKIIRETSGRHLDNILTYLRHRITNAVAEGINSKIQQVKSAARGFRNFENYRTAILFFCGKLDLYPQESQ